MTLGQQQGKILISHTKRRNKKNILAGD